MNTRMSLGVAACVYLLLQSSAIAVSPNAAEMAEARRWAASKFEGVQDAQSPTAGQCVFGVEPCFSFAYDGKPSAELLKTWKCERASTKLDDKRTQRTIIYSDPTTKLEVRCEAIEYADFPAAEWVVYFENKGDHDTPILANVQAIDTSLIGDPQTTEIMVHHARGTKVVIEDFGPVDDALAPGAGLKIGCREKGMSSVEALPFFNVDFGGARGMIAAVGWSGSWSANISRDAATSVTVKAGMDSTHLLLHPGERIRTPRMVVLLWQADRLRGHNLWRRLMLTHYSPRPGGKPLVAPLCETSWGAVKAEDQIAKINWWGDHKLPMDCFWIDAGWNGTTGEHAFRAAANRVPNPEFYPHGMKEVSDAAHQRGMKFLLWTWPHRALPGVEIGAEHPEWLINNEALDHGNPVVNQWMIDKYSKSVDEYGLDVFRVDGHVVIPADSGSDRQGINQIRYFEGFYAFWDALLQQHPNLLIDNCAGGGTKIDIETSRRSIPLWRSDYANTNTNNYDPAGIQAMTYGLSFYAPLSGGCSVRSTPYDLRSGYSASLCLMWHLFVTGKWEAISKIDDKDFDFARMRKLLEEYVAIRAFFYEDFYPLSPYSVAQDAWMAWQFDRPEKGDGMVQAFRRVQCGKTAERLRLHALDPAATYEVKDWDIEKLQQFSGKELIENGLPVTIADQPGAVVITYKKKH
jgi:alpha-galactosidase